jgi:hypothetical protein
MLTIFQGNTGGYFEFPVNEADAISGYITVIGRKAQYRFDGELLSGYLNIPKSGISNLPNGNYTVLPQIINISNLVYYLDPEDLEVIEVPDFFSNAVLVPGDSVLVRLSALENASTSYSSYIAGNGGVQHGKILALINGRVVHADSTNIAHANKIIGVSIESASSGDIVRVQQVGLFTRLYPFSTVEGDIFLGTNGEPSSILLSNSVFRCVVGNCINDSTIYISIDRTIITLEN